ncbi:hypothetical protein HPP92_007947 [Vanilla planifolia]|uniref:GPI transamidase component PIG-T n=1 Tax=Vanilla planifolia TaxID=51239 RepID=A0A835RL63_VANPL|nr:hypothetical protein HPP92_007947 [Vanilla planifolia]
MVKLRSCFSGAASVLVLFFTNSLFFPAYASVDGGGGQEEFSEELLLKPLPDRKVLAHFHFESLAPPSSANGRHHHLFPKAIAQLGFLHIDEYPPDANQGFDIPSALVTYPELYSSKRYEMDYSVYCNSSLLSKFQEGNPVHSYTEVLLVPLTTPDFSMPYNVITFTCTVLALYFGSMLNVLLRRVGEEERLSRSKDSEKVGRIPWLLSKLSSKLKGKEPECTQQSSSPSSSQSMFGAKLITKVILVAALAVIWNYYLKDG